MFYKLTCIFFKYQRLINTIHRFEIKKNYKFLKSGMSLSITRYLLHGDNVFKKNHNISKFSVEVTENHHVKHSKKKGSTRLAELENEIFTQNLEKTELLKGVTISEDVNNDQEETPFNFTEQDNKTKFKEISNGNAEIERQLKILEFEIEVYRERFGRVPERISKNDWENLLLLKSSSQKRKMLQYLFIIEKKKENRIKALENKKNLNNKIREMYSQTQHLQYNLCSNSLFIRIYDQTLIKLYSQRLASAALYSQHLVLDCSYQNFMSDINSKHCAKQILMCFSGNRRHPAPFHLQLCNVNNEDFTFKFLNKLLVKDQDEIPLARTEKSFFEVYPKEKLVYLTPDAKEPLLVYNHDDVYIMGAYVDKGQGKKLSLAKAKELNLRMAKLPIDNFVIWRKGFKTLPLNIVLDILLDMRLYNDWNIALKNIPNRCLQSGVEIKF